jgi:hypothetical protein
MEKLPLLAASGVGTSSPHQLDPLALVSSELGAQQYRPNDDRKPTAFAAHLNAYARWRQKRKAHLDIHDNLAVELSPPIA